MANRQKISQMTPKGANLAATDLLEISEDSGTGYITKSITGQEIIDAAAGGSFVPYTGATQDVDLGAFSIEATTLVKTGGLSTEFLMADGTTSLGAGSQSIILTGQPNAANTGLSGALRFYGFSDNTVTSVEINRRTFLPNACTLKFFYIRTSTVQPATGNHVLTILKNGVATSIVVTISAGSAAGVFSDLINSVSFAAGDEISIQAVNNATGNSGVISSFSIGNL